MTTPDYILRFAEAIAPGNAELLLTGGTEEAILNAATDTISDLRKRNAELEAQRDALLETCEMVFPVLCGLLMEKWGANYNAPREAQGYVVYAALKSAIAKAQGDTSC